ASPFSCVTIFACAREAGFKHIKKRSEKRTPKHMNEVKPFITIRGIVFSAIFAALMVIMSFVNINLGFSPVPITLENMAPMLAGAFLGPFYGFLSIFLVVFLTALGVPLLHAKGGLDIILGPTGGFIWMFPIAALLTGLIVKRISGSGPVAYIKVFIAIWLSSLTLFLTGIPSLGSTA